MCYPATKWPMLRHVRSFAAYDAKHQLAMEGDNRAILAIGQGDFPLPIPLIRKDGMWRFDTAAGRGEILARRIGKNELGAIQACLAYVDAQNDYAEKDRTGAGGTYTKRIISQPGKKDGLYWPTAQGTRENHHVNPANAAAAAMPKPASRDPPSPSPNSIM